MKVQYVSIRPTEKAEELGLYAFTPELLASVGARYSRNNEGLDAIASKIDFNNTDKSVDSIFKMLKLGRIDYFHRGLNEIWGELSTHKETLKIADNVMLFYPLPVYFFVTKSRPELAKKLEKGINLALEDGSFKTLFQD